MDWARVQLLAGSNELSVRRRTQELNVELKRPLPDASIDALIQEARESVQSLESAQERRIELIQEQAQKAYAKSRDDAAQLGSRVHQWVEYDLSGESQEVPQELAKPIGAYLRWRDERRFAGTIGVERIVYYAEPPICFAGTVDVIFRLPDRSLAIVDFKTSNGIYETHMIQVAAYAKAWEWLTGERVSRAWAVRFDKKSGALEEREANIEASFEIFKALLLTRDLYGAAKKSVYKE